MDVKVAESDAELERIGGVLGELRPAFGKEALIAQVKEQQKHGYRVAYLEADGEVLCVAGFVVQTKLAWGKHVYVDDLVTSETHRSRGAGEHMIRWLKRHARELGCTQLHLDSSVKNFAAHRFYLRNGFVIASHHLAITDLAET